MLDEMVPAGDTRKPTIIADTLLPQLGDVERDTIARYVRKWRTDLNEGRRDPTGGGFAPFPQRQPST
jgi:hypothetical protein